MTNSEELRRRIEKGERLWCQLHPGKRAAFPKLFAKYSGLKELLFPRDH